jgi:hypothetical protein
MISNEIMTSKVIRLNSEECITLAECMRKAPEIGLKEGSLSPEEWRNLYNKIKPRGESPAI